MKLLISTTFSEAEKINSVFSPGSLAFQLCHSVECNNITLYIHPTGEDFDLLQHFCKDPSLRFSFFHLPASCLGILFPSLQPLNSFLCNNLPISLVLCTDKFFDESARSTAFLLWILVSLLLEVM